MKSKATGRPNVPTRRHFLQTTAAGAVALGATFHAEADDSPAEVLYNGITLPSPWPPRSRTLTREPMTVPYLQTPPAVLPIDVGRQLFVDDFLIAQTTLRRTFHQAIFHRATPVLRPDQRWEQTGQNPTAMVFSDGVWYDPAERRFKTWYMGGSTAATCYAVSPDGIRWEKPALDIRAKTNIVRPGTRDSATVWLDLVENDPRRRYKLFRSVPARPGWALDLHFSSDGIHWTDAGRSGPCGDRTTVFYNPFRRVWVCSVRTDTRGLGRTRGYREGADWIEAARWRQGEPVPWVGADRLDPMQDDLRTPSELYNLDAVAYESILLGLFSIWRGQPRDRPKPNEVLVGFSRDGFHWHRPDRRALLPVSERHGAWNWGNVQSAGGCCLVVGDQLYFYCSGRAGVRGTPQSGVCTTGLATLRRDGFASMDAGAGGGTLTTRPVRFRGRHVFVNVDAADGELRVEVLDREGQAIAPLTRAGCTPLRVNSTCRQVRWEQGNLGRLAGQPVRFRFHLTSGRLFAFWVSPEATGASHGYVAAGGPGFRGPIDTVGVTAPPAPGS
jgi:hypothetical protein